MCRKIILIILIAGFCSLYAQKIIADSLKSKRKIYYLDEIRVIAKSPDDAIGKTIVKSIGKTNISSDTNLSESLKDVSGLSLTVGSKGESSLKIRTFSKESVKIMVDGRVINGGYFGNVSLNEIPMFDLDEVQVVKGPVSSIFGTNNMGGVVNYITKKPNKKDWLKFSSIIKRNNTLNNKLTVSHEFDQWDFWVNLSRLSTEGFILSDDFKPTNLENGKVRNFSSNGSYDVQSKINFSLFDLHSLGLSLGYTYADKKEIPSSIYEPLFRQFTDWKRYQSSLISNIAAGPYVNINNSISYDAYNNTLEEYLNSQMTVTTLHSVLESWIFGYKNQINWEVNDDLKAVAGYQFEKQVYNRKDNISYLVWTTNNTQLHNFIVNLRKKYHPFDFNIGSGFSFSLRNHNGESIKTGVFGEPSAGMTWKLNKNYELRFGFAANIQYPTMHELYSNSRGNPYLVPERAYKTEINFNQTYPGILSLSIEHSLFYNSLNHMIEQYGNRYENRQKLKNQGYENNLLIAYKKLNLENQISYTNLFMNNAYVFYKTPGFADHLSVIYNFNKNMNAVYKYSFFSKRYDDNDGILAVLDPYQIQHINFNFKAGRYKFTAGISNLFDTDYQEEYGYPGAGINYMLGMEMVIF